MLFGVSAVATAQSEVAAGQQVAFRYFGLSAQQIKSVVVDSALTRSQALGSMESVPPEGRAIHATMTTGKDPLTGRRLLEVVPVVYHGYDGNAHVGQIVVHSFAVEKVLRLFYKMWCLGFPIYSVIPQSRFRYDDQASMSANNTMGYRPELGSEHRLGFTFDLNPRQNPFDRTKYTPNPQPIEPSGAIYDPAAQGTIVKMGPVREAFTAEHFEWGGGWGDPGAVPPTDYFREGYYDYMHFQPDFSWYDDSYRHVPMGV